MSSMTLKSSYFRFTNPEIVIPIPALKRPTLEEVHKCFDFVHSIKNDYSTEEPVILRLSTVLSSTEKHIDSETYKRRLKAFYAKGRILGFQHFQWFLKNKDDLPKTTRFALNALPKNIHINFSGILLELHSGSHSFPYIEREGKLWSENWQWVDSCFISFRFNSNSRIAVFHK